MKYDFKAFGQAIKEARKAKGISRNQLADRLNIAPRYIASVSYTHLDVYKRQIQDKTEYKDFIRTVCGTKNTTPKPSSISNIRISLCIWL